MGVTVVGTLFAATAAAKPGIGPDWFIPGGRPKNVPAPREPDIESVDEVSSLDGVGMLRALLLTLLFAAVPFDFTVDDVPALSVDASLDLTTCRVGVVAKWLVMSDGLENVLADDVDTVATDLRSAALFIPVGARPHLLVTQPPTLPIRPRLF